jgi:hypothetical protein
VIAEARWKQHSFLAKHLDRLARGAHAREGLEKISDRLPNLRIGIQDNIAGIIIDEAGRENATILAPPHLVENAAAQPDC